MESSPLSETRVDLEWQYWDVKAIRKLKEIHGGFMKLEKKTPGEIRMLVQRFSLLCLKKYF